jgi:tetratricopeptide (TPR) repeat protein
MAEKIKYTEKELKQPDRFVGAIESAVNFAGDHSRLLLAVVGAIIVILVGAYFINITTENKAFDANIMFNEALDLYNEGNEEEALAGFLETAETYSGESISNIAIYYAGLINYNLGNYEDSRQLLSEFLASDVKERMLRDSAILTQGLASYSEGNWTQAIEYLTKLESGTGSPYETMGKLHLAFSYQRSGQPQKANEVYKDMYESVPGFNPASVANRPVDSQTQPN